MSKTAKHRIISVSFLGSTLLAALVSIGASVAVAETVQIPVGQQGQDKQNVSRPRAGMSQNQVKEMFGNPIEWTNPVGEPPITKWIYSDFIVVFEYDHVIHSVLKHTPQPSSQQSSSQVSGTDSSDSEAPIINTDSSSNSLDVLSRISN